jgi:hypothetical protein
MTIRGPFYSNIYLTRKRKLEISSNKSPDKLQVIIDCQSNRPMVLIEIKNIKKIKAIYHKRAKELM